MPTRDLFRSSLVIGFKRRIAHPGYLGTVEQTLNRRELLLAGSIVPELAAQATSDAAIPIIDTHIHLYDPSRPQGVPWPPKDSAIYEPTLPSRLLQVTRGMGVTGALEVECSPWIEDNQWVLDVAAKAPVIVGMVGNLKMEEAGFRTDLERFAKNPLFRGVRYGYLWDRDLSKALQKREFQQALRDLAAANLSFDTANPSVQLLADVVRISDIAPELRVIIDHLPALYPPSDPKESARYMALLGELKKRPNVYAKLSATLRTVNGKKVSHDLKHHKSRLDLLYETFGPDRVIFGSDWPNSDLSAPYSAMLGVVQAYFRGKSREEAEKYFWRNSVKAYRWVRRNDSQPVPA